MIGQWIGKCGLKQDKCKILYFGYANARTEYLLGDEVVTGYN